MDQFELETARLLEGDGPIVGSLVELIVAASDTSDDAWEIGDCLDEALRSDRVSVPRRF